MDISDLFTFDIVAYVIYSSVLTQLFFYKFVFLNTIYLNSVRYLALLVQAYIIVAKYA